MKKNLRSEELQTLFAEIDQFYHIPFDKLKPLNDDSQHDNVGKLPSKKKDVKSKVELQELFCEIDKLCPKLPPKLTKLEEPVGKSKNHPKTIDEIQIFLKEIDSFSQTTLPPILTGLEELKSIKKTVKNYPKTKDELDKLLKEIGDYFHLNLPFKLGDLNEKDQLFDEPVKCPTIVNKTTVIEVPLEEKRQQFQRNYFLRNNNKPIPAFPFKDVIKVNKNAVSKSVKQPPKPKTVTRKYVLKAKNKTTATIKNDPKQIYDCKSIQSYYRNILAATKPKPPKIKAKRKPKELANFSDSDYGSSSQISSPASNFSFSSGSTSCSTNSTSSTSSVCSLISTNNSNGKTIYFYNQYDKYLERKNMKKQNKNKVKNVYQPIYRIEPVDRHQKVIEWTCKDMADCPSTPINLNCSETPPISPYSMDNDGFDGLLNLDCLQNFSPMTTTSTDKDTLNFDHWLSNHF